MTTEETSSAAQPVVPEDRAPENLFVRVVHLVERFFHPNYTGLVVAAMFFGLSLTPSLLPRDWFFQGLISGINATISTPTMMLLNEAKT